MLTLCGRVWHVPKIRPKRRVVGGSERKEYCNENFNYNNNNNSKKLHEAAPNRATIVITIGRFCGRERQIFPTWFGHVMARVLHYMQKGGLRSNWRDGKTVSDSPGASSTAPCDGIFFQRFAWPQITIHHSRILPNS
ncbi:uncharacterized protein LOC120904650 [Anopheles arabiensis]|uniref:uncharacterized protein LOC120904650 n=1 Tax=Anopheles arabiensis TaxID=7173 RepID=UPI001AAD3BD5|nr:uncharacterized protein LOC120904650 [Anopheles arabiensis]